MTDATKVIAKYTNADLIPINAINIFNIIRFINGDAITNYITTAKGSKYIE